MNKQHQEKVFCSMKTPLLLALCITLEITGQQARHCQGLHAGPYFPLSKFWVSISKALLQRSILGGVSNCFLGLSLSHDNPTISFKKCNIRKLTRR